MTEKTQVMETWFSRVWSQEDETAIDQMLVSDTTARGLGSQNHVGPAEFKAFQRALLGLVGNVRIDAKKTMEDGDWLSALVVFNGTRRDNGKPVSMTGHVLAMIVDGKIVDAHNHFDWMGLFEQCDLLPAKSFERCLSCQKIG
ncbi:ester cyclase [Hoeflea sp.]|uniref:ester cyclase n=1 Tax=Hoeflea sp. TaxID=1940281 RepID=UPI003B0261EE